MEPLENGLKTGTENRGLNFFFSETVPNLFMASPKSGLHIISIKCYKKVSHFHLAWYQVEYRNDYPKYQYILTATESTEN